MAESVRKHTEDQGAELLKRGFEETQSAFHSASQTARVTTELWAKSNMFCPNCGNPSLTQFAANRPVADFYCRSCGDEFELKSQSRAFGRKVANGAYATKIERLKSDTSPNLILLHYDRPSQEVVNLKVVPKHFFSASVIEERPPLKATARRAGWIGSNILLDRIPLSGQINVIKDGLITERKTVLQEWRRLQFLRLQSVDTRGWLLDVLNCIERIDSEVFSISEVYAFESMLSSKHPKNKHVRAKMRQQLQKLRDHGYIEFLGKGMYRVRSYE